MSKKNEYQKNNEHQKKMNIKKNEYQKKKEK